jgi:dihydrolipoamide dehydrogenase
MSYDLIVIGAGPGGYVCAIRAAQLGLKTAIVEKRRTLGGTCANVGCIPSKALLHATELFDEAGNGFAAFGIEIPAPRLNLPAMMKHKADTVASNVGGVALLMKKNKVDTHYGTGTILSPGKVEVTADDGKKTTLESKSIVIATGSDVAQLRGGDGRMIEFDEKVIVSSTGALELAKVPGHLVVVGAGVIGLELGSVWKRLGSKVTAIEFTDKCLGGMDAELGRQFQRLMEKQGMIFHMSSKVTKVEKAGTGAKVTFEPVAGGAATVLDCDVVLIATGRVPYTIGLGQEKAGVALERGRVVISDHFETNIPGIYAIGDVVRGAMLAHKAEEEGVALAEQLAGQAGHVNYDVIPGVVYTYPEVAAVGKTEEELKAAGIAYNSGKFPFMANGRARANRTTDGFVKVLADAATDRVLGVHIIGAGAGELIHEAAVLMEFSGSAEDLARTCHAHPTMSEAVKEAALAVAKRAIHM